VHQQHSIGLSDPVVDELLDDLVNVGGDAHSGHVVNAGLVSTWITWPALRERTRKAESTRHSGLRSGCS
jgi:hypothetical protein